jgi:serine-type D-Ala-D-Ala carboxypeptidase (penicillin-binding protein 5/6)
MKTRIRRKRKKNSFKFLMINLPKLKKSQIQTIKIGSLTFLVLVFCFSLLLLVPQAVNLTEVKLADSFNQPWEKPQYLISEVSGKESKQPQIVDTGLTPPNFASQSVIAMDFETGQILYQKNIHQRLAPASTTKIATAWVAVDLYQPGDILTVSGEDLVGGSTMGLGLGERLSFRSLLYGMLLNSGNDAAFTIASNYPGGVNNFISLMNQKVISLGLKDTNFTNPAGFDGSNHYSSAYDLAVISKQAVSHPQLATVIGTKNTSIQTIDGNKSHLLRNLNQLLDTDGVIGIKTGTTEMAGANFVGLVERNGHKVITVVLRSPDRFGETKNLMNWVYSNYKWE